MTHTTDRMVSVDAARLTEPYWRYAFDAEAVQARTDTPDLLDFFLMAEGYREFADEDRALAEADMAAGFETLPPE